MTQLHTWTLTPTEAVALQRQLACRVDITSALESFDLVAGVDCSYNRFSPWFYAAVVLWRPSDGAVVEAATAIGKSPFPYVPGLLSFRELPIVLEAYDKLKSKPDVIMLDGQGYAHPRRFGLASHLGVWLDTPTIGCAKTRLIGEHDEPAARRGSSKRLTDKTEVIGRVLRTRDGVKPLYISCGHKVTLDTAVQVVLDCGRGYRLPEPTRLAHHAVNEVRRLHE